MNTEYKKTIVMPDWAISEHALLPKIQVYDVKCLQCGHNFLSRDIPEKCPKCESPNWNVRKEQ